MTNVGRVAVLGGTGNEGGGLALRWARAGIPVVIGSRRAAKAEDAAAGYRDRVPRADISGAENAEAAASCNVVVITVPFTGLAATCKAVAGSLRPGTVVIDATVPVAASVGGRPTEMLGAPGGSAARFARSLLPDEVHVCSAFHSLSAAALYDLDVELEGDVLACGPKAAKPTVEALVEALPRLRFVDAGGLSMAAVVEPLTALLIGINHRYGTDRSGIHITGI